MPDATPPPVTRRSLLLGAGVGLLAAGCGQAGGKGRATATAGPNDSAGPNHSTGPIAAQRQFADLEGRFGVRLGVHAVDTGTGATLAHRADERFLLCSTYKAFAAAALLQRAERDPALLSRVVHFDASQLVPHSPVTTLNVGRGMTVRALCAAAMTVSDNTAANLMLETLGGPAALTAFFRTLHDPVSRLDRTEPTLNVAAPGDVRDTTSPRSAVADLRALALGEALDEGGRRQLLLWLNENTTGTQLVRAGLPSSWTVGDRSGGGTQGQTNDIAIATPPGRSPIVLAVYTAPADPASTTGSAAVAAAARIVAAAL
jgi:beta-lactamase class A